MTTLSLCCSFQLEARALKDYNRGRSYLASMANKSRVPVLKDVSEATQCCIRELRVASTGTLTSADTGRTFFWWVTVALSLRSASLPLIDLSQKSTCVSVHCLFMFTFGYLLIIIRVSFYPGVLRLYCFSHLLKSYTFLWNWQYLVNKYMREIWLNAIQNITVYFCIWSCSFYSHLQSWKLIIWITAC